MLILASSSPRRQEILRLCHIDFKVQAAQVDEHHITRDWEASGSKDPALLVKSLAKAKAGAIAKQYPKALVLGADTVVVNGRGEGLQVLGKPQEKAEAYAMLESLSGHKHRVYTGVALLGPASEQGLIFHDMAEVEFYPLDDFQKEAISRYVESGQAMDKAGAYGIQDEAAALIKGIQGDFFTVMGLPLSKVMRALDKAGYPFNPAF
ncbi:MAG: Maf family protein [Eubacteriales bacterium]|nr:Maf family protein [Eubacteriales bacterium]